MNRHQPAVAAGLVIVSLALAIYAPTLAKPFMFDDLPFILYETGHRDLGNIPSFFTEDQHLLYRPLRSVAYTLMYAVFDYDPIAYRILAVLLHALFSILMAGIAMRCGLSATASFLAGLLFLLHPVHADRVANTTAAFDLIGPLFGYAGLYFLMRADQEDRRPDRYVGWALLLVGLTGGEESLIVPFVYLAWRLTLGPAGGKHGSYAAPFAMAALYLVVRTAVLGQLDRAVGTPAPFLLRMAGAFPITLHAAAKTLLPFALRPAYGVLAPSPASPAVWASIAFFAAVAYGLWRGRARHPFAVFAALWFAFTWAPFSNLIPNNTLLAERYLYIPAGAYALLGGWLFDRADLGAATRSPRRNAATGLVFAALLSLGALTVHRGIVWSDEARLWTDAFAKDSRSALALVNYGNVLKRRGELDPCPYYYRAMSIDPDRVDARVGWGGCLAQKGELDNAMSAFRSAHEAAPDAPEPLEGVCQVLAMRDRYDEARACALALLERDGDSIVGHYVLGYSAFRLGDYDEARGALTRAADDSPDAPPSARAAADLLMRMPRGAEP